MKQFRMTFNVIVQKKQDDVDYNFRMILGANQYISTTTYVANGSNFEIHYNFQRTIKQEGISVHGTMSLSMERSHW